VTTPYPFLANNELVAAAWIASITGLSPAMVATQLPAATLPNKKPAPWVATGFVTVAVVGGQVGDLLPVNEPVIQVDCYWVNPGSNKPPWFKANALASVIQRATWDRTGIPRLLTLTANGVTYPNATVQTAYVVTPPRRLYGDGADYARYQMDLALQWITTGDRLD
jgi:hypothetical protein